MIVSVSKYFSTKIKHIKFVILEYSLHILTIMSETLKINLVILKYLLKLKISIMTNLICNTKTWLVIENIFINIYHI